MNKSILKEKPRFNYSGYGWEGKLYDDNLSMKEIAERIRFILKKQYPECKFSVVKNVYSGGASINISLMSAPYEVFSTPNQEKAEEVARIPLSAEDVMNRWQSTFDKKHSQINQFYIDEDYMLNNKGKEIMKFAKDVTVAYNFNDSDAMTDYFHTNFYEHLAIGKWDKPFQIK